jgi:hypothetical protein
MVPPISEFDPELGLAWFIPKEIVKKKTATGKEYWIVNTIDDTNTEVQVKCWGVKEGDVIVLHKPYMVKPDYDETWGFSVRSMRHQLKLLA